MTERTSPSLPVQPVPAVTMPKRRTPLRQTISARESSSAGSRSPYSGTCAAWWADWAQKRQFSGQAPDLALTMEQACRPGAYFSRTLWAREIRSRTSLAGKLRQAGRQGQFDRRPRGEDPVRLHDGRVESGCAQWLPSVAQRQQVDVAGQQVQQLAACRLDHQLPGRRYAAGRPAHHPERFSAATGLPFRAECRSK